MPMSLEQRKIYNEKYYAEHKKNITEKLLVKLECPNCSKLISKANLERHKIGNSCLKNASKHQSNDHKSKICRPRLNAYLMKSKN